MVVLAGGLATRMRPITSTIPKSMIEVAGEPFVAHQLRLFRRQGIKHVVLCVGYLSEIIEAYVGDGRAFGLDVVYSPDGEKLLGTGGAVRKALPHLGDEFLLIYGDSYLDISYRDVVEAFHASGRPALMTVLHNRGRWDTSNIEFEKQRILAYSKQPTARMEHIDYGLSMLKAQVFDGLPVDDTFDLAALYRNLIENGNMAGYEVDRRFYEIGSPSGLAEIDQYLSTQHSQRRGNP